LPNIQIWLLLASRKCVVATVRLSTCLDFSEPGSVLADAKLEFPLTYLVVITFVGDLQSQLVLSVFDLDLQKAIFDNRILGCLLGQQTNVIKPVVRCDSVDHSLETFHRILHVDLARLVKRVVVVNTDGLSLDRVEGCFGCVPDFDLQSQIIFLGGKGSKRKNGFREQCRIVNN